MIPRIKPDSPLARAKAYLSTVTLTPAMIDFGKEEVGNYADEEARGWYFDGEASRPFNQLNADVLSKCLQCYISVDEWELEEDEQLPIGASKTRGLPHLPASIAWPQNTLFLGQFNLSDVKPHDIQQQLPAEGMLYFFFNPGDTDCYVIYYDGPLDKLAVRPYPEEDFPDREYYIEDYEENEYRVEFKKGAQLAIDELLPLVPEDMKAAVESILGCKLNVHQKGDIFGQPAYWQGENEVFDEEQHEEEADLMLFQYEFGEGNIHFWISREELENRDFSKVHIDYSGT